MTHESEPTQATTHTVTFTEEEVADILVHFARKLYAIRPDIPGSAELIHDQEPTSANRDAPPFTLTFLSR